MDGSTVGIEVGVFEGGTVFVDSGGASIVLTFLTLDGVIVTVRLSDGLQEINSRRTAAMMRMYLYIGIPFYTLFRVSILLFSHCCLSLIESAPNPIQIQDMLEFV
jgi:hypothetical protein